ncbi:MAG: aldehyde ferredoxin oxidoreductase C-terminal domain-containing protein, partial [Deltaproteobacteria bacterium]|nr:aldehyde ferredoxin oxidoreductase C-terminal domain-containing protein [Deltaproteobacteria bacterium]
WGTANMVERTNRANAFPTRYWSRGHLEAWEKISAQALHQECRVKPRACAKCFIACGRLSEVTSGRHAGLTIEGPEYETIFAFGGLCMIEDIKEIAYLNDICDRLGLDTISAGNLCGLAIEASRRKCIPLDLDYGDVDGIAGLLYRIAKRKGVGADLADGTAKAARKWGLEAIAAHAKGLEPPGYDPRVLKGSALAFAVSDRGACHLRATFHNLELSGLLDPGAVDGKAAPLIEHENRLTIMDTFILCRFFRTFYPWETMAILLKQVCGIEAGVEGLIKRAEDIARLIRRFNLREGLTPADDHLSKGLFRKDLENIRPLEEAEVVQMVREYYRHKGWNNDGIPE